MAASLAPRQTSFDFKLNHPVVNAKDLPQTRQILAKLCPEVLETQCLNPLDLPFGEEVKATEVAHLFEHILLLEMCRVQVNLGYPNADFAGRTIWDPDVFPPRRFTIQVDAGAKKLYLFPPALQKAIYITEAILASKRGRLSGPVFPKLSPML